MGFGEAAVPSLYVGRENNLEAKIHTGLITSDNIQSSHFTV